MLLKKVNEATGARRPHLIGSAGYQRSKQSSFARAELRLILQKEGLHVSVTCLGLARDQFVLELEEVVHLLRRLVELTHGLFLALKLVVQRVIRLDLAL